MKPTAKTKAFASSFYLVEKSGALIGTCTHGVQGWRFLPNNAAHQPSRKGHETPTKCIPEWAFSASDDLLTLDEWKARKELLSAAQEGVAL